MLLLTRQATAGFTVGASKDQGSHLPRFIGYLCSEQVLVVWFSIVDECNHSVIRRAIEYQLITPLL